MVNSRLWETERPQDVKTPRRKITRKREFESYYKRFQDFEIVPKLFRDPSCPRNIFIPLIIQAGFPGRGISSNGRALALHAGGTGIDTQILHFVFFSN